MHAYARRTGEIDWVILASFRARVVHRKVGETLPAILGRPIRAETVSGRQDAQCCRGAFHGRRCTNKVLMLDNVVLGPRGWCERTASPALLALTLRPDG
jgi:hypothetical protein